MFKTLILSALFALWISVAGASTLSDLATTKIEKSEKGISISVFELKNQAEFYLAPSVSLQPILEFQNEVKARTQTDPYYLLRRQRDVFAEHGFKDLIPRYELVLAQKIDPISYLEQMFFEHHQELVKKPLFGSYSEFGAHVLVGSDNRLVVIFVSNPQDAAVPELETTTQFLKDYLAQGFRYELFVHNHPFNFQNPVDIAGTTIPSGTKSYGDVSAFINQRDKMGLQSAWITNGFNTLRIPAQDFDKY